MSLTLPPLPYAYDALAPHISSDTLHLHYDKHHKGYLDKLNGMIEGKPEAKMSLEEIIVAAHGDKAKAGMFNNAAQVWNHSFYWNSMKQGGGGEPTGDLADAINASFSNYDSFRKEFLTAGAGLFGSGWLWLVAKAGRLELVQTGNAELPLPGGDAKPLFVTDVWEHAYYVDYQNRRPDYLSAFIDNLVNWDFAAKNFAA